MDIHQSKLYRIKYKHILRDVEIMIFKSPKYDAKTKQNKTNKQTNKKKRQQTGKQTNQPTNKQKHEKVAKSGNFNTKRINSGRRVLSTNLLVENRNAECRNTLSCVCEYVFG